MNITLSVTHAGGEPVTVDCGPATLIACERHFGKTMGELVDPTSVEVMAWLAWEQTRRNGTTAAGFDAWVADLNGITAGATPGPFPATG